VNYYRAVNKLYESYKLIWEGFNKGETYVCEDIFKMSKNSIQKQYDFYYLKAGFDGSSKYQNYFKKFKKENPNKIIEVYGFKNLSNPSTEYHFCYLFRVEAKKNVLVLMDKYIDDLNDSYISFAINDELYVSTPAGHDETLHDIMMCDFFLPAIPLDKKTRSKFGEFIDVL